MMAGLCVQQSLLSSHQAVHIHAPYQHLSLKQKTNCLKLHSCKMPIRHACVHLSGVLLAIFCRTSCSVYSTHFPGSMSQEFLQILCETAASRFNEACFCALGRGSATIIAPLPLHLQLGAYLNDACVGDGAGPLIGTLLSHLQRVPSQGALVTMGCDADVQLMQGDEFLTVVNLNAWAGSVRVDTRPEVRLSLHRGAVRCRCTGPKDHCPLAACFAGPGSTSAPSLSAVCRSLSRWPSTY